MTEAPRGPGRGGKAVGRALSCCVYACAFWLAACPVASSQLRGAVQNLPGDRMSACMASSSGFLSSGSGFIECDRALLGGQKMWWWEGEGESSAWDGGGFFGLQPKRGPL